MEVSRGGDQVEKDQAAIQCGIKPAVGGGNSACGVKPATEPLGELSSESTSQIMYVLEGGFRYLSTQYAIRNLKA